MKAHALILAAAAKPLLVLDLAEAAGLDLVDEAAGRGRLALSVEGDALRRY
jgi:hypothetical protein